MMLACLTILSYCCWVRTEFSKYLFQFLPLVISDTNPNFLTRYFITYLYPPKSVNVCFIIWIYRPICSKVICEVWKIDCLDIIIFYCQPPPLFTSWGWKWSNSMRWWRWESINVVLEAKGACVHPILLSPRFSFCKLYYKPINKFHSLGSGTQSRRELFRVFRDSLSI